MFMRVSLCAVPQIISGVSVLVSQSAFLALLHLLLSNHCDIFIPGTLYFVCGLMEQNSEVSDKHGIAVRKMGRSQESHSIKKCRSVFFFFFAYIVSKKWY